jgi:AraC-like DNA-binding protein
MREMTEASTLSIQRWSTRSVPSSQRFDYYFDAMSRAVAPVIVERVEPDDFLVDSAAVAVNGVSIMSQSHSGAGHWVRRGPREISLSQEHSFHLLLGLDSPWKFEHRGQWLRLRARDAVLYDSNLGMRLETGPLYNHIFLKLSEQFVRQWVARPTVLVGRRMPSDLGWGAALSAFVAQLTPEFVCDSPLPTALITEHVGSLLALTANELGAPVAFPTGKDNRLCNRICQETSAYCAEPSLTASVIAQSLKISVRTLHRCLAASGLTFGKVLMSSRISAAQRMLKSPLFKRVTAAEIGRRVGFSDPSHFVRVFRRHTGSTPTQVR